MQHPTIQLLSFVVQGRKRVTMHRHEVSARDEEVHLAQRHGVVAPMAPRAVEDDEHVIPVLVELGALGELLGVLERERMKAEDSCSFPRSSWLGAVRSSQKKRSRRKRSRIRTSSICVKHGTTNREPSLGTSGVIALALPTGTVIS